MRSGADLDTPPRTTEHPSSALPLLPDPTAARAVIARAPSTCYLDPVLFAGLFPASPDARRRRAAGLLAAALALHDAEEAFAYPRLRPAILEIIPFAPPAAASWAALAVVTLAGVAAAAWAGRGPASAGKMAVLRAIAAILLVNVLVPHVPAAVVLGGYAPGVITAVALNLPAAVLALRLLRAPSAGP